MLNITIISYALINIRLIYFVKSEYNFLILFVICQTLLRDTGDPIIFDISDAKADKEISCCSSLILQ